MEQEKRRKSESPHPLLPLLYTITTEEDEAHLCSVNSKDLAGLDAETVKDGLLVALTYGLRKYGLSDSGYKIMRKIHEIGVELGAVKLADDEWIGVGENLVRFESGEVHDKRRFPSILPLRPSERQTLPSLPLQVFGEKAIAAVLCRMGFSESLSIQVITLFLDTGISPPLNAFEDIEGLPVVGLPGKFSELTSCSNSTGPPTSPPLPPSPPPLPPPVHIPQRFSLPRMQIACSTNPVVRRAQQLVWSPDVVQGLVNKKSEISIWIRKSKSADRILSEKLLLPGSSIGTFGGRDRGTLGFFVREQATRSINFLTCSLVVASYPLPETLSAPIDPPNETEPCEVVCPGNLDAIMKLHAEVSKTDGGNPTVISDMLRCHDRSCGFASHLKLGVDQHGRREDWALVDFDGGFEAISSGIWNGTELTELLCKNGEPISDEFLGVVRDFVEPVQDGQARNWYKDGSTTGWTSGTILSTEARHFIRSTTMGVDPEDADNIPTVNIVSAQVLIFKMEVDEGDGGGRILRVTEDQKAFALGAMAIARFVAKDGDIYTFAVSVPTLLEQVNEETGQIWEPMNSS